MLRFRLEKNLPPVEVDPVFIDTAVDFIRTYADRCHHGKEEDLLFKALPDGTIESNWGLGDWTSGKAKFRLVGKPLMFYYWSRLTDSIRYPRRRVAPGRCP